jgi:hypothetical protein
MCFRRPRKLHLPHFFSFHSKRTQTFPATDLLRAVTELAGKERLNEIRSNLTSPFVCSNSKASAWSPSRIRFVDHSAHKKFVPGPGTYNPSDMNSSAGGYILSNLRNGGNVKFVPPRMKEALRSSTPMNRTGKYSPHIFPNTFKIRVSSVPSS